MDAFMVPCEFLCNEGADHGTQTSLSKQAKPNITFSSHARVIQGCMSNHAMDMTCGQSG